MANEDALSKGFPSDFDPLFQSSSSSSSTHYYNLDDSTTSDLSAINQTGVMFMSHDQLEAIATAIQPTQPLHVRCTIDTFFLSLFPSHSLSPDSEYIISPLPHPPSFFYAPRFVLKGCAIFFSFPQVTSSLARTGRPCNKPSLTHLWIQTRSSP